MSSNDPRFLPKPIVFRGGCHLNDPGKNPSGIINVELRLNCLGRSFTTYYQLRPKYLIFKSDYDKKEYCVKRALPPTICADQEQSDVTPNGDNLLARNEAECLETENLEEKKEKEKGDKNEKNEKKEKSGKKKKK